MRYTVRTPDGELTLPSRRELQDALTQGLVGPEDEVREEGGASWRKVGQLPGLTLPRRGRSLLTPKQTFNVVAITTMGLASLWLCLFSGQVTFMGIGGLLAFVVVAWLFRWTQSAFSLRRRR